MIAAIIFLVVIILIIWSNRSYKNQEYDERQLVYRGIAYRTSAMVMICCAFGSAILLVIEPEYQMYGSTLLACIAFLGVTIFAVLAIWNDAFHSTTEKPQNYALLLGIVLTSNAIVLFLNPNWTTWQELITSYYVLNLLIVISFGIILITFLAKWARDRKEEQG